MTPDAHHILGLLWSISLFLWLRQERVPQPLKAGLFYAGGLLIILSSGLPSDVTAAGSALFVVRSLIMASIPMSLGMVIYVRAFESSPHRIPFFPLFYSAVVMIAFVYLINWTILAGFLRWISVRSVWLVLYMESFIRMSGLCLSAWMCARAMGREQSGVYPVVVVIYLSVYIFFQGFQSGPPRGVLTLFSYSLGAIIVGIWVFKTPPRVGGLRRIAPLLSGMLLIFCSGLQAGLDFFFLAGRLQNLHLSVMVLALIQLWIWKVRQGPERLFASGMGTDHSSR